MSLAEEQIESTFTRREAGALLGLCSAGRLVWTVERRRRPIGGVCDPETRASIRHVKKKIFFLRETGKRR
jgi:hypothetical protein